MAKDHFELIDPARIPVSEQRAYIRREIIRRENLIDHFARRGTISETFVRKDIACLKAILYTLEALEKEPF